MANAIDKKVIDDLRALVKESERLLRLARTLKPSTEEHILRGWVRDTDHFLMLVGRRH